MLKSSEVKLTKNLALLIGKWSGTGKGGFPTIESFDYEEELIFESDGIGDVIHYFQRTWHKTPDLPRSNPIHSESGFIRLLKDEKFELVNSQNSGRVEIMQGKILSAHEDELNLFFESTAYNNDPRMVRSAREFCVTKDKLSYIVDMATDKVPEMQIHLEADLKKIIR